MLTRMRAAKRVDKGKGLLGDGAHGLGTTCLFHVQNRPHVKASHRGMRIPGALCPMLVKDGGQLVGIVGKVFQFDSAVLEKGHRLCFVLLAHHNVEAGFPPFGNTALHGWINGIDHTTTPVLPLVPAKAKIAHHLMKPC